MPRTPLALAAAALSRRVGPDFLFNHCMRTFVFGAITPVITARRTTRKALLSLQRCTTWDYLETQASQA